MRILFIIDPLENLSQKWDNSLALARWMLRRGHECWTADVPDIWSTEKSVHADARPLALSSNARPAYLDLLQGPQAVLNLMALDLVIVRKEPPFDLNYYYLTLFLDRIKHTVAVSNDPAGIRKTNEKLGVFCVPKRAPRSLVTCSPGRILQFQRETGKPVVLKPLNEKGGKGVRLLKPHPKLAVRLSRWTGGGTKMMIVQERIRERGHRGDKRILLLEGRLLTAYRKHPPRGDFRSNLSIGGTSSETSITGSERSLIRELRPYLLREGLHLAGLDVMGGKLLDLNVTCPAGMTEAETLCPGFIAAEAWGFFLERRVKRRRRTLPNSRP